MADVTSAVKECSVTTRGHSTVLHTDPRATRTLTIGPRALCSLATVSESLLRAFLLSLTSGCWWDFFHWSILLSTHTLKSSQPDFVYVLTAPRDIFRAKSSLFHSNPRGILHSNVQRTFPLTQNLLCLLQLGTTQASTVLTSNIVVYALSFLFLMSCVQNIYRSLSLFLL